MANNDSFVAASWQLDLGKRREIEAEIDPSGKLWAALGAGMDRADVWIKNALGAVDLRIRMERAEDGLVIAVDRGEQEGPWWKPELAPRLVLRRDETGGLRITAAIGTLTGDQQATSTPASFEFQLGSINLPRAE